MDSDTSEGKNKLHLNVFIILLFRTRNIFIHRYRLIFATNYFLDFRVAHKGDVKLLNRSLETLIKRVNGMYKSMNRNIRKIQKGFDKKINALQENYSGSQIKELTT